MNAPFDMSATIIAKSDQLNSDDLIGGPRTIVIRKVSAGESEQPVNVYYEGDADKPFRPCKTVRRIMVALWGKDANQYVGRAMTLIRDGSVLFGGMQVGGIRISHMSHISGEQTVVVMKTKGKKAPIKIQPLQQQRTNRPSATDTPAAAVGEPQTDTGQPEAGSQQAREIASRDWTDKTLRAIAAAEDRVELAAVQAKRADALYRLRPNMPAMAAEVDAAILERLAAIEEGDAGEPEPA